jgi:hypothetical protein
MKIKPTLSHHHGQDGPLSFSARDGFALPMIHLLSKLNLEGPASAGREALSHLFLAVKVLSMLVASSFVRLNMLVKRFRTDGQSASNLFRAPPLQLKQTGRILSHPRRYGGSFSALLRTLGHNCTGLLRPVAFRASIVRNFFASYRFVSIKQLSDLGLIVPGFYKGVDRISFNLAEMFIVHRQLQLAVQEA